MLSYMLAIQFGNSSTRRIRRREYIPFLWFKSDALCGPGELAAIREWDRLEKGIRRKVLGIFGGSYWGFWISYKVERIKWFICRLFLFMIWPELPSSSSIRRGRSTSPTWSDKRIYPALGIPKGIGKYFKAVCGFRPESLIFSLSACLSLEEDSLYVWKAPRNVYALPLEVSKWGWTKWRYC